LCRQQFESGGGWRAGEDPGWDWDQGGLGPSPKRDQSTGRATGHRDREQSPLKLKYFSLKESDEICRTDCIWRSVFYFILYSAAFV